MQVLHTTLVQHEFQMKIPAVGEVGHGLCETHNVYTGAASVPGALSLTLLHWLSQRHKSVIHPSLWHRGTESTQWSPTTFFLDIHHQINIREEHDSWPTKLGEHYHQLLAHVFTSYAFHGSLLFLKVKPYQLLFCPQWHKIPLSCQLFLKVFWLWKTQTYPNSSNITRCCLLLSSGMFLG